MSWLCWKRTQVHVDSLVNPSILWDAQVINCQQYTNQMHIAMFACTHTHTYTLTYSRIYNARIPMGYIKELVIISRQLAFHWKLIYLQRICTPPPPPNTHTQLPPFLQFLIYVVATYRFYFVNTKRLKPFQWGLLCVAVNWPCVHLGSRAVASPMMTLEVLKLGRAGDEPHVTSFLHKSSYPPVIVEFLFTHTAKATKGWVSWI